MLVARDRSGQTLDFLIGNGLLTKKLLVVELKSTLDTDALLFSDANPTCKTFCMIEGISHEVVNLSQDQRVRGAYHVENVNAYHSRFKQWLERFNGVTTKYLPNYLGWQRTFEQHSQLIPEPCSMLSWVISNI